MRKQTEGQKIAAGYAGYMVGQPLADLAAEIDAALAAEREKAKGLVEALSPFVKAYNTWSGGKAIQHFADSVCPADFMKATKALAAYEKEQPHD